MKQKNIYAVSAVSTILAFSMITSALALEENGKIEMPFTENPPAIDGAWTTSDEWSDTTMTTSMSTEQDKTFYILAKHDRDNIYLLIDLVDEQARPDDHERGVANEFIPESDKSSARNLIAVCFDPEDAGGNVLQNDDFCFVGYNQWESRLFKLAVTRGDGKGSNEFIDNPSGYKIVQGFSSKNDPNESGRDHVIYEIKIPISFLHKSDSYGFYLAIAEGSKSGLSFYNWPPDAEFFSFVPSTFGSIVAPAKTITIPPVPVTSVSPESLSFGSVRVSEVSQPKTVTVSNTGSGNLKINSIRTQGEFSVDKITTPMTIPPGSKAEFAVKFAPISEGEKKGSITIISNDLSNPTLIISASGVGTLQPPPLGGGCLIATAAFGSELTPQVQFLRNFRDSHILSTVSGSSFMNVFNAWYYSFSPYVAEYEREQPWLQQTVKALIYPLLGILQISETGYSSVGGEYGALVAGAIASSMIGALYFSPVALSVERIRKGRFNYKLAVPVIAIVFGTVIGSIIIENQFALMITTSLFVLTLLSVSAIIFAKLIIIIKNRIFLEM